MTREHESLTTTRLKLRRPTVDDAEAVFYGYAQDREVTRFLVWRPARDLDETRRFLGSCLEGWASGKELTWAITLSTSGDLIGMVACRPRGHMADLGYVLARSYWGKGYMTEALSAVVDWLFSRPELYRVWAVCDTANVASARVMEKVGMTCEGILRRWNVHPNVSSEPRDCYVYARVR
ncbi:MAG TPA: GNAT family N-acetyltransferase [Clostridiales bacterium]|nr:GNAT family N-acetyltransferase [Clostridiales bacterium]